MAATLDIKTRLDEDAIQAAATEIRARLRQAVRDGIRDGIQDILNEVPGVGIQLSTAVPPRVHIENYHDHTDTLADETSPNDRDG